MKRVLISLLFICLTFACACAEGEVSFLEPFEGIVFPKGEKYPVYYGPDSSYDRMADGKATVSTNGWIRVYGGEFSPLMDRDGNPYHGILIEYEISEGRRRFGWIRSSDLPDSISVWRELPWQWGYAHLNRAAAVTDDPFYSQSIVAELPEGTAVRVLYESGQWAYVSAPPIRGFVHPAALTRDEVPYRDDPDLVQVARYFENTGIKGRVSGMHQGAYNAKTLYFTLDRGGTAKYDTNRFDLYEMNWDFDGICDDDLALFLDFYLGLLVDAQNGKSPQEHLRFDYYGDVGRHNIEVVVSNCTSSLEYKGEQWLNVLLKQLAAHDGNDQLNRLRAITASKMLGNLDITPVEPFEGCAWFDALTLAHQDDLPPVDASIYEKDPLCLAATQALIAYMQDKHASWSSYRDVDRTKTRVIVALDVCQVRETDNKLTLWASVAEGEYALYDGKHYQCVSGSWVPSRIAMEKDAHGQWVLDEVILAEDGTRYQPSIVEFCEGDKALASRLIKHNGGKSCDECFFAYLQANDYTGPFEEIPY